MKEYYILTPGDKVKNIRTRFNLNQEDITCGEVTRNLISIIENNKGNLTETTAKILVDNINRICKERNLGFSTTTEYLLESVLSQSKKVADSYIEFINALAPGEISKQDEILTEIDIFLKNYDTEEKRALLYIEIGLKFKADNLQVKASEYFLKAYECSQNQKCTTIALVKLTACSIYLSKYSDAINYSKILLDLNFNNQVQFNAKYNMALSYKNLKQYNNALEILNSLKETHKEIMLSSSRDRIDVEILIGNCHNENKFYNKALIIYKELLKIVDNDFDEIFVLSNLADVYRNLNDATKLEITCKKILNKINAVPGVLRNNEAPIYLSLAKNIQAYDDTCETASKLLIKTLEIFKANKSLLILDDAEMLIIELLNIYIKQDNSDKIKLLQNELFELVEWEILPRASMAAMKFIKYLNFKGKKEEITHFIDFLEVQ